MRTKVSQKYLEGSSYSFLSKKYNIGKTTLKQWVAKHKIHGIVAFSSFSENNSYFSDFKKMCVEALLRGEGSADDVVAKYNISSHVVLRNWDYEL